MYYLNKGTFLDVYLKAMVVPLEKEHNKWKALRKGVIMYL